MVTNSSSSSNEKTADFYQEESAGVQTPLFVEGFTLVDDDDDDNDYNKNNNIPTAATGGKWKSLGLEKDPAMAKGPRRPINLAFCPTCSKSNIRTRTKTYPNGMTWVCVGISAIAFFPICWIPLVVDSMKQTNHYCPHCNQKLGTIKPLQGCFVKEES